MIRKALKFKSNLYNSVDNGILVVYFLWHLSLIILNMKISALVHSLTFLNIPEIVWFNFTDHHVRVKLSSVHVCHRLV